MNIRSAFLVPFVNVVLAMSLLAPAAHGQKIIAHRGASAEAPENTLPAFRLALKRGADGIEVDLRLTKDGRLVIVHDATFKRTAGLDRPVKQMTLAEVRQLDVGAWKGDRYAGTRVPTLAELLAMMPAAKKLFAEVKGGPGLVAKLKAAVQQSKMDPDQIAVISFNDKVIAAAKRQMPKVKALWLTGFKKGETDPHWRPTPAKVLDVLQRTNADGVDARAKPAVMNADFVRTMNQHGYEVHAWTVNRRQRARRLRTLGVDSITTNVPGRLQQREHPATQPSAG